VSVKHLLIVSAIFVFFVELQAQIPCWDKNRVPNSGFESYRSCQENKSIQKSTSAWIDYSLNIDQFPPSMDFFSLYCNKKSGFYAEIPQDNPPHTDNSMLGGFMLQADARTWTASRSVHKEYAYCELNGRLSVGKTYRLQFYVKFAQVRQFQNSPIDQIGAVLSEDDPTLFFEQSRYNGPVPIAQSEPGQLLNNTNDWVLISQTFVADKPYQYLMLGNFYKEDENVLQNFFKTQDKFNAYYLFDEVSLQEWREEPPYQNITIDRVCNYRDTGRVIVKMECGETRIIQRVFSPFPDTIRQYTATYDPADVGVFIRKFKTAEGCDSVVIDRRTFYDLGVPQDSIARFFVPTAFSPNGDGRNDHFVIFTYPLALTIKQLAVYTHWGQKAYFVENFEVSNHNYYGWDGLFINGTFAPQGTYVWVLSYEDIDGSVKVKRGTVALMR
jgi:gliding motility-associated-like protein